MPDTLAVLLSPARVEMDPGGIPAEVTVTIQNLGDTVDQYSVEVDGLASDWFTPPTDSVSLFPRDHEQVPFTLRPPRRPDVQRGVYPFRVLVRSRAGAAQATADGVLAVSGVAAYRLDLAPRRQASHGEGTFQVQLANTGTADVALEVAARDPEEACAFHFPKGQTPLVRAGAGVQLPLRARPRKRPWIGEPRRYDFSVIAHPRDAAGESQTVSGQLTYEPRLTSWAPIRTALLWLLALCLALAIVGAVFTTVEGPVGWARAAACRLPLVSGLCGSPVARTCSYQFGFEQYAAAEPKLIGDCTTAVQYDEFGNGLQYSRNGVLFWQKQSNTVYFFRGDSVWGYVDGTSTLLHGSGSS